MTSRARTCKQATNGHTPKAIALLVALREQDGHRHLLQEALIHKNYTEPQTGPPPKKNVTQGSGCSPEIAAWKGCIGQRGLWFRKLWDGLRLALKLLWQQVPAADSSVYLQFPENERLKNLSTGMAVPTEQTSGMRQLEVFAAGSRGSLPKCTPTAAPTAPAFETRC